MKTVDNSRPVTQTQFYGALAIVWLYIMLVVDALISHQSRWILFMLLAVSFLMVIAYVAAAFLARQAIGRPMDSNNGD